MSEELEQHSEDKITKVKSPGRVAAGKNLAEMNNKNKTKKVDNSSSNWDINPGYVIRGMGIAIAAGSLYLQWRSTPAAPPPIVRHESVRSP